MKSIVIYYSQSGNTRKIAKAIHKGMAQKAEQCDIAQVKAGEPADLNGYDLIGLGSPVWMGGVSAQREDLRGKSTHPGR